MRQPIVICGPADGGLPTALSVSDDERSRAEKLVQNGAKTSFLRQHHLLRRYLSHWLGIGPGELRFVRNPYGKPSLENSALHFNISRSGNRLAFYFGPTAGGIDIEELRPSAIFHPIIARHFHPNEQLVAQDDEGFFALWTRKEALLKAIGSGLTDGLSVIDCTANRIETPGTNYSLTTYAAPACIVSLARSCADTATPLCFEP